MAKADVIIVGAGLAGLCCARRLEEAGVSWILLEGSDGVGGRVRTDEVGGFLLDRGFQVLLTAYPECRRVLDYRALDLKPFDPGSLVRYDGRFSTLADPWRRPGRALRTLFSPVGTFSDKLRIARLRRSLNGRGVDSIFQDPERTTLEGLRDRGFSERMIESFFRPFLGGIFLEPELDTSDRMFQFVFKMFSAGETVVPARGMQAIPDSLAASLPAERVRLGARVRRVEHGRCTLDDGEALAADTVVVATDGGEAARLLGSAASSRPRSTTCLYFDAPEPPIVGKSLVLDGEDQGPANHLCVISEIASGYAPAGRALISVNVLGIPRIDEQALERAVRTQLTGWFGKQVADWRPVRQYRIEYALPGLPPRSRPTTSAGDTDVFVCGDHASHGSIEGAMVSGRRTAEAILAACGQGV
jgi:phytoene dehydrogenase-like protein